MMNFPDISAPIPTLQNLSATVVVRRTTPEISQCNSYICNMLLDLCVRNNQLRIFRTLLEKWPHEEAHLNLRAVTLHYLQSLAILEHQGVISKVLRRVFVSAPYAGYTSTNVLCDAALGLLEDYTCLVSQVKQPHFRRARKRPRLASSSSSRTLSVFTPLNINNLNIKTLLRYLRTPDESKVINIIPTALIFTSLQSALIFKALDLVDPSEFKMLGMDFSLQSDEELSREEHVPILNKFQNIRNVSLTYNHLNGHDKELNLINSLKSMPNLCKLNLSGNDLKSNVHLYVSPSLRELIIGNTRPSVDSLSKIGEICGENLLRLKLSDNNMENKLSGLHEMLSKCEALISLDLAGCKLETIRSTRQLLQALQPIEPTLETLILSHNMFKEPEREMIIAEMSKFSSLKELVLGPYLPDLLLSEDLMINERKLMSEECGRPDIRMCLLGVS